MAGKELDLALRVRADLADGQKSLDGFGQSVVDVGEAAQQTNTHLTETGRAVDALQADSAAAATALVAIDNALQGVAQGGQQSAAQIDAAAAAVDGLAADGAQAAAGLAAVESALQGVGQSGQQGAGQVTAAALAIDNLASDSAEATASLSTAQAALQGVAQAGQQGATEIGGAATAVDELASSGTAAAAAISTIESSLQATTSGAQAAASQLDQILQVVMDQAAATSRQLATVGETADQQAERIRAMVAASLEQQAAVEAAATSNEQLSASLANVNANWQENARAQTAAANLYHNTERALLQQAEAERQAAEDAAAATEALREQEAELGKLLGQIDPTIRELERLDDLEQRLRGFQGKLLDQESFDLFNAKLREQRERLDDSSNGMRSAGISAGQYQQAMRQLPMQLTDITTSLASGMPLWMVAIQQGGQIKDSFGGAGNAARALVSLLNPLTVAIAGVVAGAGALVLAWQQGSAEANEYNKALILTGNYAGVTAGQLAAMAREMDGLRDVSQGSAAAALTEVASSGKFAGDQIKLVAVAAEQMRVATGKAVSETVAEFADLAKDPVTAILKLNETQHFLTAAQLEQIRTLQLQQGEQAAATEAMRVYAAMIAERTPQITQNLSSIERAWREIKTAAVESWDGMVNLFRPTDDAQRITELTNKIAYLKSTIGTGFEPTANTQKEIDRLGAELDALQKKQKAAQDASKNTVDSAAEAKRQAAADAFIKSAEAQVESLSKLTETEKAHRLMQQQGIAETSSQGQAMLAAAKAADDKKAAVDAATKAERDHEAAQRKSRQEAEAAARQAKQAADQQENFVQGLERQAATQGKTTSETRAYELAEKGLTGTLRARAEAALAVLAADERRRQADADAKQLANVQVQLLEAQGQQAAAASLKIEQQYGELLKRLQARSDTAGADLVQRLISVSQAKAQLDQVSNEIERVFSEQARQEQSIQAQQQAGLISELGARQQLLDLHKATADQVEKLLPQMQALAEATGNPDAIERVKDLQARLQELRTTSNQWEQSLKNGIENGLQSALEGLATRTQNLKEAATSFLQEIARSMANLASQTLAQMATDKLTSLFQDESSGTSLTVGAAAVSISAAEMSAAGASLVTGAAAISTAAAALAAASAAGGSGGTGGGLTTESIVSSVGAPTDVVSWPGTDAATASADAISSASTTGAAAMGDAITSASSQGSGLFGSTLSGVFSGGADLFSSLFSSLGSLFSGGAGGGGSLFSSILGGAGMAAVAAADGGHIRGPGTETSDSIQAWLSNNEFVTRAAVVRQPGMLPLLHDINARGMTALYDWAARGVHHVTGGLAGVPAPARPVPTMPAGGIAEPAKNFSAKVANNFRFQNILDSDSLARSVTGNPMFEKTIQNWITTNPSLLRSVVNEG
ncbi:phage tail length tape measure family protein [Pseudomonas citronellolis]|uniref:phage tail length tape measure family protein n=1 Tax=Pseudomonas citronellolis TaxID=53408 RepID=UPI0008535006|nr:phage tail length tape measure family protein [Pseudomonas humi]